MTRKRNLTAGSWEKVTSNACVFQVIGQRAAHVTEQASTPGESSPYKIALPGDMYAFDPVDGALYIKALDTDTVVGYDLT